MPGWVFSLIAVSVTVVWVVLNIADPFLAGYKVNAEMHFVMGALVGGAFGGRVIASYRKGDNGHAGE